MEYISLFIHTSIHPSPPIYPPIQTLTYYSHRNYWVPTMDLMFCKALEYRGIHWQACRVYSILSGEYTVDGKTRHSEN